MNWRLLLPVMSMAIALGGCDKPPAIAQVYIDKSVAIGVGEKHRLTFYVSPPDADKRSVSWLVEDPGIVSIDRATGELTGLAEGTTKVAATARGGVPAVCEVTVEFDLLMHIPDPALREECERLHDQNHNGNVSLDEADRVGHIGLKSLELSSLEGLENYPNLTRLSLNECKIESLDLSKLPHLTFLAPQDMELTELDVSMLPALEILYCGDNLLRSLDISNNPGLTSLYCEGNPGEGGVFVVRSWFDNESVPSGRFNIDDPYQIHQYHFPRSWEYEGQTITADYRKVD